MSHRNHYYCILFVTPPIALLNILNKEHNGLKTIQKMAKLQKDANVTLSTRKS